MKVLLTNMALVKGSGTIRYLQDLAPGLRDRGIHCTFYAPKLSDSAEQLKDAGFEVVDRINDIRQVPDLIHGQHSYFSLLAAYAFPNAKLMYICHDAVASHDTPIPKAFTDAYAAVDSVTRQRIVESTGTAMSEVHMLGNTVDTEKFTKRDQFQAQPRQALILSGSFNNPDHFDIIREACRKADISLDELGSSSGSRTENPENLLKDYDIVFAKARCAMEAMATGAYVIIVGEGALGPSITPENIAELRQMNFGRESLIHEITTERVMERIAEYSAETAKQNCEWVRENLPLSVLHDATAKTYREIIKQKGVRRRRIGLDEWRETLQRYQEMTPPHLADLAPYAGIRRRGAGIQNLIRKLSRTKL